MPGEYEKHLEMAFTDDGEAHLYYPGDEQMMIVLTAKDLPRLRLLMQFLENHANE